MKLINEVDGELETVYEVQVFTYGRYSMSGGRFRSADKAMEWLQTLLNSFDLCSKARIVKVTRTVEQEVLSEQVQKE